MTKHETTCTDEMVKGRWGTVARCTCGWVDAWMLQGGNAEASAHDHVLANDPEAREKYKERLAEFEILNRASRLEQEKIAKSIAYRPQLPPVVYRDRCHTCSCPDCPPCGYCENCNHWDVDDCPNDCQTCEIDHYKDES